MELKELYGQALALAPWITEQRRILHSIPERGFSEFKTQAHICSVLDNLSIPYVTERTWIVGEIRGAQPGPIVALRADIDALPVTEPEGLPFRSTHEGWMHACGHDAHTAILLGAARLLKRFDAALKGTVRLLFQPAEETDGGAQPMVAAGAMDGVSAVYGLHVQPYMNVGEIDTRPGCLNASTDEVNLTVHGVSGHAARPHLGIDAIACAGHLITALQTLISRRTDPLIPAVLTFGAIEGGSARNVLCDRVQLKGTLRTADPRTRQQLKSQIRTTCEGIAAACGATVDVEINDGYDALINNPEETARVLRVAAALLGDAHVHRLESPSMGGEDFSYFAEAVPGAFYHIGCSAEQPAAPLHSRSFLLDERCLPIGSALQCALVLDRMEESE